MNTKNMASYHGSRPVQKQERAVKGSEGCGDRTRKNWPNSGPSGPRQPKWGRFALANEGCLTFQLHNVSAYCPPKELKMG